MAETFDFAAIEQATARVEALRGQTEDLRQAFGGVTGAIDLSVITELNNVISKTASESNIARDTLDQVTAALQNAAKMRSDMEKAPFVSDKELKAVRELEKIIKDVGVSQKTINKYRKEFAALEGKNVVAAADLSRRDKRHLARKQQEAGLTNRITVVGGKAVALEDKKEKAHTRAAKAMENEFKSLGKSLTSMAGLNISLVGLIALMIKLNDISNKFGAMSQQIRSQWNEMPGSISRTYKDMYSMRYEFNKGVEAAGEFVKALARAGFEEADLADKGREVVKGKKIMVNMTNTLAAVEQVYGQSLSEQVGYIQQLVSNFKELNIDETQRSEGASLYLETIRQTVKTIPMLSMDEAIKDVTEMANKQKAYNVDLLGTLALYNTLMRQDIAKKLGLGDAPRAVRKEIVQTIAGFSKELEDGWKAALGKGTTAAARILEFEKLFPEDQFARMFEFIQQQTGRFTGETQEFAVRQLLKQFGFTSTEVQKVMGKAFVAGGLDAPALKELAKTVKDGREAAGKIEEKAKKDRADLIKKGMNIANMMTDLLKRIKLWLEKTLLPVFNDLREAINALRAAIPSTEEITTPSEMKQQRKRTEKEQTYLKEVAPKLRAFTDLPKKFAHQLKLLPGVERGAEELALRKETAAAPRRQVVIGEYLREMEKLYEPEFKAMLKAARHGFEQEASAAFADFMRTGKAVKRVYPTAKVGGGSGYTRQGQPATATP